MVDDPLQCTRKIGRSKVFFWIFLIASALTVVGVIFWPLELDVYYRPGDRVDWVWNDLPAASTETANFWWYFSLRPLLYLSALAAFVSFNRYKHAKTNAASSYEGSTGKS